MNPNLQNKTETTHKTTCETIAATTAPRELIVIIDLLAAVGLAAEAVFDGDAGTCPHCRSQVLSEAA